MPMNCAFTAHGFQGTDMAVISGHKNQFWWLKRQSVIVEVTVPGITRNTLCIQNKTGSSFNHNHTYVTPQFKPNKK